MTEILYSLVAGSSPTKKSDDNTRFYQSSYDPKFTREIHYADSGLIDQAIDVALTFMGRQRFLEKNLKSIIEPLRLLSLDIVSHSHYLADIESRWTSRSWLELVNQSLPKASETIKWFCDIADIAFGRFEHLPSGSNVEYREDPLGVVAAITPWNDPLVAFAWKVVPALISGNCVIWKPSEHCLETAFWVVKKLYSFGMDPERLQLLLGDRDVGEALICGQIQGVSFTGSSHTARHITGIANRDKLAKMHIEAGGKGVAIVDFNESDAMLERYVRILCEAAFANQGQICSAPTIVFTPSDKLDQLVDLFQKSAISYAPADPTNHTSKIGGLISYNKKQSIAYLLDSNNIDCITLTNAIDIYHGFNPTLVINPPYNSHVVTEELFGPVVVLMDYSDLDEGIRFINNQEYGLANGLFSQDRRVQERFSRAATGGILHINSWGTDPVGVPFGGTKNSGFSKEKCISAINFFTTLKPICRIS